MDNKGTLGIKKYLTGFIAGVLVMITANSLGKIVSVVQYDTVLASPSTLQLKTENAIRKDGIDE